MLYEKHNLIGLDSIIGKAQKKIYAKLTQLWGIDIEAFPRCYVLEQSEDRKTVEHSISSNEYSGNLIVSEKDKFFFTAESEQERINNRQFQTEVKLYFILDLKYIYPDEKERCDSKVLADIVKVIDLCPGLLPDYKIVTDYQAVFEGFFYEFDNIQPYYCLRLDFKTVPYTIDQNC